MERQRLIFDHMRKECDKPGFFHRSTDGMMQKMSAVNITEEERHTILEDYTTQKFNSVKAVSMRTGIKESRVNSVITTYLNGLKK